MILLHNKPLTFEDIKRLPKINDHIKEQARVSLIEQVIEEKQSNPLMGHVVLKNSFFFEGKWSLSYEDKAVILFDILFELLKRGDFKNIQRNENVYFYRLLNVAKLRMGERRFSEFIEYLVKSPNGTLVNNVQQYVLYQQKIKEIERILDHDRLQATSLSDDGAKGQN